MIPTRWTRTKEKTVIDEVGEVGKVNKVVEDNNVNEVRGSHKK